MFTSHQAPPESTAVSGVPLTGLLGHYSQMPFAVVELVAPIIGEQCLGAPIPPVAPYFRYWELRLPCP